MCLVFYCSKAKHSKKEHKVRTCRPHQSNRHHYSTARYAAEDGPVHTTYRYYNYGYDLPVYPGYGGYAYDPASYLPTPPPAEYRRPRDSSYLMHTAMAAQEVLHGDAAEVDHVYYRSPPTPPVAAGHQDDLGCGRGPGCDEAKHRKLREKISRLSSKQKQLEEGMERDRRREAERARRDEAERILEQEAAQREGFLWGRNYERQVSGGGWGGERWAGGWQY